MNNTTECCLTDDGNYSTGTASTKLMYELTSLSNPLYNKTYTHSSNHTVIYQIIEGFLENVTRENIEVVFNTGVPEWLLTGIQVYLGVVALLGSFGNMLTLIAVSVNRRLQNAMMAYVVNLAVTDWLVCSVMIPVALYTYKYRLPHDICRAVGFFNLLFLMVSVFSLALISINRYVLVCKSRSLYARWYSPKRVMISIFLVWVIAVIIFMPPFIGWGKFGYNQRFGTCLFIHPDQNTYLFVIIMADGLAIIPTVNITVYCYVKILLKFKESRRRVQNDQPQVFIAILIL